MSKPTLTTDDYCRAAKRIKCEVAAIQAVAETESRGNAFYSDGFPVILFERHIFRKFTNGKYNNSHPHLSGPAGNYGKAGQNQRNKFNEAFALNQDAAMKACSWGAFQIMGFNHEVCGYTTVGKFVDAMKESEGKQLDAFVSFVKGNHLDDEIRELDWAGFAKGYNGPLYRQNKYDTKMATAYKKYSKQDVDCSKVSAAIPQTIKDPPDDSVKQIETAKQPPNIIVPLVPDPQPVIAVEAVTAEPEATIDTTINKWSARYAAIPAAGIAFAGSIWSTLTSSPVAISVTLIVAGSLIVGIYFLTRMIVNSRDKARKDKLQAEREQRAHEIMLVTLKAAADPSMNTVKVVSPPHTEMANSDSLQEAV